MKLMWSEERKKQKNLIKNYIYMERLMIEYNNTCDIW